MQTSLFTQRPPAEVTGTIARNSVQTSDSNNSIFTAASSPSSSSSGSCICVA